MDENTTEKIKTGYIYKITNNITKCCYIGKTVYEPNLSNEPILIQEPIPK